jgi:hypothetical protein
MGGDGVGVERLHDRHRRCVLAHAEVQDLAALRRDGEGYPGSRRSAFSLGLAGSIAARSPAAVAATIQHSHPARS